MMKNFSVILLVISLIGLPIRSPIANENILVGYGAYQSPPFVILEGQTLVGGIMKSIGEEIGKRMKQPVIMVEVPRKRLVSFLEDGLIDIRCHLSPVWIKNPEEFLWTSPLYKSETRLAAPTATAPHIKNLVDLHDKRIGMVLGFFYAKSLNDLIKTKQAEKVEARSVINLIRMMDRDRLDVVVGNKNHLQHLLKYELANDELAQVMEIAPLVIRSQDIHCALSSKNKHLSDRLLTVIDQMRVDGTFDTLVTQP